MLKELFLIGHGVPFFYYCFEKDKDSMGEDVVLSSGFLTALKEFSERARAGSIDSFTTEQELFLFTKCSVPDKILVGIFERGISIVRARETMQKLFALIQQTSIPLEVVPGSSSPEKEELKKQIDLLINQSFGIAGQAEFINELLQQRTNIPLAFLIDADEKKVLGSFARPKQLFRQEQVRDFLLFLSTFKQTFNKLGLPETYSYLTISSNEYVLASIWSGRIISIASGVPQTSKEEILKAALNMSYYENLKDFLAIPKLSAFINQSILLKTGTLKHESGDYIIPSQGGVFLSTLINTINSFFKTLVRRNFEEFEIILAEKEPRRILIKRLGTSDDFKIEIFKYI